MALKRYTHQWRTWALLCMALVGLGAWSQPILAEDDVRCPMGYERYDGAAADSTEACFKGQYTRARKGRPAEHCPEGQTRAERGRWKGYCVSCPTGFRRDDRVDAMDRDACISNEAGRGRFAAAERHERAKGLFGQDCPDPQFLLAWPELPYKWQGYCLSCPSGFARTEAPADSRKACIRVTAAIKTVAAERQKRAPQSCPRGQFHHRLGPESWFDHCVSCPSGYERSSEAVDGAKACVKRRYKRAL